MKHCQTLFINFVLHSAFKTCKRGTFKLQRKQNLLPSKFKRDFRLFVKVLKTWQRPRLVRTLLKTGYVFHGLLFPY
jgi:hypothetical protein